MKWGLIDGLNLNHSHHSLFISFGNVSVTVPVSELDTRSG